MKLKSLINIINPPPKIGGLEITDGAIRYVDPSKQASLRLPAGVIQGGQVKNKKDLTAALSALKKQISSSRKPVNAIVSVSSANVYTQVVSLPLVPEEKMDETARLNLQIISPIDVRSAYYDWQEIGEADAKENRMEVVGAFVIARVVDDLAECLHNAGFAAVAVESAPLSLARAIHHFLGKELDKPALVFNLSGDGLDFFVLRGASLYFSYFVSWGDFGKNEATLERIKNRAGVETKRILNFYTSRWGGLIEDLVLVSPTANKELAEFLKKESGLKVRSLSVAGQRGLSLDFAAAFGASLRGLIPRSKDMLISLAGIGTEERFYQSQIINFSVFWRSAAVVSLAGVFIIFGLFDLILLRSVSGLEGELKSIPAGLELSEAERLEKEARAFNNLVDKAVQAGGESAKWSPLFYFFRNLAGGRVALTQIQLQKEGLNVSLRGEADSERGVLDFKNKLINEPNFEGVNLPLTSIKVDPSGKAIFNANFKLKKWPVL